MGNRKSNITYQWKCQENPEVQLLYAKCRYHENPEKMESYQENPENKLNIKKEVPRKSSIRTRL